MNNYLVVVHPMMGDAEEASFIAAVAQSDRVSGEVTAKEAIPSAWNGQYQRRFISVEDVPYFERSVLDEQHITHMALLTGPQETGEPFYFNGEPVHAHSILLWFNGGAGKYVMVHCPDCAAMMVYIMQEKQEAWRANGGTAKAAGACH